MHKVPVAVCWLLFAELVVPAYGLTVLAPAARAVVRPGEQVTVRVLPASGEQVSEVHFATSDATIPGVPSPTQPGAFEARVTVPWDAFGREVVVAVGGTPGGPLVFAEVELLADPGPVQRLIASPLAALTLIGQVAPLEIVGLFSDGTTRDLGSPERGTTYASRSPNVVAVHRNGFIQARADGIAFVDVTNRHPVTGRQVKSVLAVAVDTSGSPANRIPVSHAGADQLVIPETVVSLSAAGSADADGESMTFEWTQIAGRLVLLHRPDSVSPRFVAPRVAAEEVLEFSLIVRDAKGATGFPDTVRVTVRP